MAGSDSARLIEESFLQINQSIARSAAGQSGNMELYEMGTITLFTYLTEAQKAEVLNAQGVVGSNGVFNITRLREELKKQGIDVDLAVPLPEASDQQES